MAGQVPAPRVVATTAALEALARLVSLRGPVLFFQSGGCCEGSVPMCFALGDFVLGDHDVLLAEVCGCGFYIDHRHFEVLRNTQLILDVAEGEPEGFSLGTPDDRHFVTRSRVFAPDEVVAPFSGGPWCAVS